MEIPGAKTAACGKPYPHARRQHAQRNVWIVPEQRRHDSRAHRRAKRLVEILLKRKRAPSGGGVTRVQGRLGVTLLKCGKDAGGVGDGPAVEPQNGQLALARRAPSTDQVVGAEHAAPVRDALVVRVPSEPSR
jgi:hypothetical protein